MAQRKQKKIQNKRQQKSKSVENRKKEHWQNSM